jgi:hypothetical protein
MSEKIILNSVVKVLIGFLLVLSAGGIRAEEQRQISQQEGPLAGFLVTLNYCYKGSDYPLATISEVSSDSNNPKVSMVAQVFVKGGVLDSTFSNKITDRANTPISLTKTTHDIQSNLYLIERFDNLHKLVSASAVDSKGGLLFSTIFDTSGKELTFLEHLPKTGIGSQGFPKSSTKRRTFLYESLLGCNKDDGRNLIGQSAVQLQGFSQKLVDSVLNKIISEEGRQNEK